MSTKMNHKQRMLRWTKHHKKKAPLQTTIALILAVILIVALSAADSLDTPVTAGPSEKNKDALTITLVGDMMFGRFISKVGERKGYAHLFKSVHPYLNEADLVTGNFEHPIVAGNPDHYPTADKKIRLYADSSVPSVLKKSGFTSVNLANNHTMDYGAPGLVDTKNAFRKAGLETVGAGRNRYDAEKVLYQNINKWKVATLGVTDTYVKGFPVTKSNPGVVTAQPKRMLHLVEKAKNNADLVVVHIHWGVEYDNNIHPRQRDLGRALVDAGADIVVGHHPHVLEPVEFYKDSVILYSLGNFIFDQGWSRNRETALVQFKMTPDGKARLEVHPMMIREGRPRPLKGWLHLYRREKIYFQLAEEMIYSQSWKEKWTRKESFIFHEWTKDRS